MKSKIKKPLVLIVMLIILAATLTACQFGITLEGEKEQYGLTAKITYHLNGGANVNNSNHIDMYYSTGDVALDLGFDEITRGTINAERKNYTLIGWYYPAVKEDGSLDYIDEENGIVNVDASRAFDFANYRAQEGDEIDLYAYWLPNQKLEFILGYDEILGNQVVVDGTTYVANGEPLKEEDFGRDTVIHSSQYHPLEGKANYTFVGYYEDVECTVPLNWPVERTESDENIKVYVKYLPGDWTIIKNASDFKAVLSQYTNNGKYYITDDINGKDTEIRINENSTFNGTIKGNGHTISGFTITRAQIRNGAYVSMFGLIDANAVMEDITFKDFKCSFSASMNSKISAYFFADSILDGATFKNVKIDGGEMSVAISGTGEWINASETCPVFGTGGDREGLEIVNHPVLN